MQVTTNDTIAWPNIGAGGSWYGNLPGTKDNYVHMAGVPWENAAVQICLSWISANFCEPRLVAKRSRGKGKDAEIPNHPILDLIARPNPNWDAAALYASYSLADISDGNTYYLKARNKVTGAIELYYLHYSLMTTFSFDGDFVSYYEYRNGTEVLYYSPEDITHIRNQPDPHDARKGRSPLRGVLREVASDNSASTYTSAILKNMGALACVVMPKTADVEITPETVEAIKKKMGRNVTGDNTGDPLVLTDPVDVTKVGSSPEEMVLDTIRKYPEDRICAALGLNTIALGLTSGAASKTYANYEQAVKSCYHRCLMPLQSRFVNALNEQLVPAVDPNIYLAWDYSEVEALQEDQTALVERALQEWEAGVIDLYEYRTMRGYEVDDAQKGVFFARSNPPLQSGTKPAENPSKDSI